MSAAASLALGAAAPHSFNRAQAASTGLWVFIGVCSALFGLFFAAYVMRLSGVEGYPLLMPWQFWLSTAMLVAGSLALERAAGLAKRGGNWRGPWTAGGALALAFVLTQLWAWSALGAAQVLPQGNPAASFLYLLTGMHGLHVLGGLIAWGLVARHLANSNQADQAPQALWRIGLCARFWHFLLALWLLLFATLSLLTPDLVRAICGTPT